jgi:transposase-like protein
MTSPRILTIDIETSPMKVWTFSLMKPWISFEQIIEHTRVIAWAAKWYGEDQILFRSEYHHGREAMLRQAHALLNEADIVIHFNGESFDIPHLRREFQEFDLAPFAPFQTIDLYKQLKKTMYFPNNKLNSIARKLGVGEKVAHTGIDLWIQCLTDDDPVAQKKAWALMRKYNKGDVIVTEDLYTETREWLPNHPNMGLFTEDPADGITRCSVCGSEDLRKEGFRLTMVGKYPRFQCRQCGKWGQEKKAIAFVQGRGLVS